MKSRFLVGLGAWLLGVGIATTGSMIAVNELAHGLLVSQAQQLGTGSTPAGLTAGTDSPSPSSAPSATPSATRRHLKRHVAPPSPSLAASTPAGTLLDSGGGSVIATCEAGGAYLLSWIPDQGFFAEDEARGPAATAKVTFRGPNSAILMKVTCTSGTPVAHVYQVGGPDGDDSPSPGVSPTDE